MSVQPIIEQLNKMIELHDSLLHLSKQKTETLKEGDMDKLQVLLKKEQTHVKAIDQLEHKRQQAVEMWARMHQLEPAAVTVTAIIEEYAAGADKEQLEMVTLALAERLMELRRQEDLNKQLTEQSLQFVQLSLDMIQPSIKNMNYGKINQSSANPSLNRSVFDSKA